MNIRTRIGKLETTVGQSLSLRQLSDAELEARIRKVARLPDDFELTDDFLRALSADTARQLAMYA